MKNMGRNATTQHINEAMNDQVSRATPLATADDVSNALPTRDTLRYVKNDTFIGDPSRILGMVYYEKIGTNQLMPFHTSVECAIDERSILKTPMTVAELIVNSKLSGSLEALVVLSLSASHDEVHELRITNNSAARLIDRGDEWGAALRSWMANPLCQQLVNNPRVGTISVVTGVVQKYITTKKYRKFEAGVKGGGWGVNVAGSLYVSSSEFKMDVLYGLDLVSFPKAHDVNEFAENIAAGHVLSVKDDLATVNSMFDNMALSRSSVFRLTPD